MITDQNKRFESDLDCAVDDDILIAQQNIGVNSLVGIEDFVKNSSALFSKDARDDILNIIKLIWKTHSEELHLMDSIIIRRAGVPVIAVLNSAKTRKLDESMLIPLLEPGKVGGDRTEYPIY